MTKSLLAGLGLLLSAFCATAQQENVWAFGTGAGIDFNGAMPQFVTTSLVADEACASVCGSNGRLLFYTEGCHVWDSLGNIMLNGTELTNQPPTDPGPNNNTWSAAQGAIIIPMPDSAGKYYIFSITDVGDLFYSVLDMSLHNGLGDIETGRKGIQLDANMSERMTAVEGNDCNVWLVTCSLTPNFKAYEINAAGISTNPVVSTVGVGGSLGVEGMGSIAISPNRSKLAATICLPVTDNVSTALFDFDASTGLVTNPTSLVLDTAADAAFAYSVCFSPDNSKLYVNFIAAGVVDQFDLSSNNSNTIPGTRINIGHTGFCPMKMGPNGKIYFLNDVPGSQPNEVMTNYALGCINAPNNLGASCQYNGQIIVFPTQTLPVYGFDYGTGLPNVVPPYIASVNPVITKTGLILSTVETYNSYQWYLNGNPINGATNSTFTVNQNGDYTVSVTGDHGCSSISPVYKVTGVTGIGHMELVAAQINIFPNPAFDEININAPIPVSVTLSSIEGKILKQLSHVNRISLQGLAAGVYWLNIFDKNGNPLKVEKIIKAN